MLCERFSPQELLLRAPVLAYHYAGADDLAAAVQWYLAAGNCSLATYSLEDALRHFLQACETIRRRPSCAPPSRLGKNR